MQASLAVLLLLLTAPATPAVTGRVTTTAGEPVAGADVLAYAQESVEARAARLVAGRARAPLQAVRTAGDGQFRLETGRAEVDLEVRAAGFAPHFRSLADNAPVAVGLERAALRKRRVHVGGRPVAGAVVVWSAEADVLLAPGEWIATTGADGSVEVPDPGIWAAAALVFHRLHPTLLSTAPRAELELAQGAPVRGRVVDGRTGHGVGGAAVLVDGWPRAESAADGSFELVRAAGEGPPSLLARRGPLAGRASPRDPVIRLQPGRTLAGSVRDEAGGPVAGARVVAASEDGRASAFTDAAGRYALDGLPAQRYWLGARRGGYDDSGEDSAPVDLRRTQAGQRDLTLKRARQVQGMVVDEQGRPVAGARVSGVPAGFPRLYLAASQLRAMAGNLSQADGSFVLQLPETPAEFERMFGGWAVAAWKQGYAAGRAELPKGAGPLRVRLERGLDLSGRVTDVEGAPVADVAVSLTEEGGSTFGGLSQALSSARDEGWTRTDAEGRWSTRVLAGAHTVAFQREGYTSVTKRGARAGEPVDVVLEPSVAVAGRVVREDDSGVAGVAVRVQRSMLDDDSRDAVVTDADGRFVIDGLAAGPQVLVATRGDIGLQLQHKVEAPAADVRISLGGTGSLRLEVVDAESARPFSGFSATLWSPKGSSTTPRRATEPGLLLYEDLAAGAWKVTVSAEGFADAHRADVAVAADDETGVRLELQREAVVRGRVTSPDGEPLDEASVSAGEQSATTDEAGDYEVRGLVPGQVALAFSREGYRPLSRTIEVARDGARLDVALSRGLSLRGAVVGSDGTAIAHARVSVEGAEVQGTETDAAGLFTVSGLEARAYAVKATAEGFRAQTEEDVDPASAGPLRLVLERQPMGVVRGRVIDWDAAEHGMVMVFLHGDAGSGQGILASDGTFRLDAPAGEARVSAYSTAGMGTHSPARTTRSEAVTVLAGAEVTVDLEFGRTFAATGTVTRRGAPVSGAQVTFDASELMGGGATGTTDAAGSYRAEGLREGRYKVSVEGAGARYRTELDVTGPGPYDLDVTMGRVTGRTVDASTGAPLAGVAIALWPGPGTEGSPEETATSDGSGAFALEGLKEGRYRLVTSLAGYGQQVLEIESTRDGEQDVVLPLTPSAGLNLEVVDARDGRRLDATVVVRDTERRIVANRHTGTGEEGSVVIGLSPGAYLLSTSASSYGTATVPISVPAAGPLRVALTPGGTLVVRSARELRGRLRLVGPDGEEYVRCWCNGLAHVPLSGRQTRITNVTPASYAAELVEDGQPPAALGTVQIEEGKVATLEVP